MNKSIRVFKIFLKEDFQIGPCDKNSALVVAFVLGSSKTDCNIITFRIKVT